MKKLFLATLGLGGVLVVGILAQPAAEAQVNKVPQAGVVRVYDPTNAYGLAVQSDGSINVNAGAVACSGCSTAANQILSNTPVAAGAATATKGLLLGGQYNTTQKTLTNGQQGAVETSARGEVLVTPGVTGFAVTGTLNPIAATTGGGTPYHAFSAASTNSTSLKGSAGTLYNLSVVNTNAATAYLKFYNIATAPTCNSDTVVMTHTLVQNVPLNIAFPVGIAFGTGIGFCITAAAADNDNGNATTGITMTAVYK